MRIDYTKAVRNSLESKLGYHGFKYSVEKSHPPTGHYEFTRNYFGKRQRVSISRVQYNVKDLSRLSTFRVDADSRIWISFVVIQQVHYCSLRS